jgi:hypothetical protein
MQHEQQAAEFDIEEARRVLGDVFAPWVQDLERDEVRFGHIQHWRSNLRIRPM